MRDKIEPITCSSAWAEYAAEEADQQGIKPSLDRKSVQIQVRAFGIYPPGPMRLCHRCKREYPANYCDGTNGSTICQDCKFIHAPASYRGSNQSSPLSPDQLSLKPREFEVFALWHDGYSEYQIAEMLGMIRPNVQYALKVARRRFPHVKQLPQFDMNSFVTKTVPMEFFDKLAAPEGIDTCEELHQL